MKNALGMMLLSLCLATAVQAIEPEAETSLYQRIGGVRAIAVMVDDFIDRVLVNETLNANPAIDKARLTMPTPLLKFHVTAMMCQATGGPEVYFGRTMPVAHAHLNIGAAEWRAMMADFDDSLAKFKVPQVEANELVQLMESTKEDIVIR